MKSIVFWFLLSQTKIRQVAGEMPHHDADVCADKYFMH